MPAKTVQSSQRGNGVQLYNTERARVLDNQISFVRDGLRFDVRDAGPGLLPPEVFSTAVQNVTGHPAVSLPWGLDAHGVPSGLQVTAPRWRDGVLLDVAERWQAAHPWPVVAPGYAPWPTW